MPLDTAAMFATLLNQTIEHYVYIKGMWCLPDFGSVWNTKFVHILNVWLVIEEGSGAVVMHIT